MGQRTSPIGGLSVCGVNCISSTTAGTSKIQEFCDGHRSIAWLVQYRFFFFNYSARVTGESHDEIYDSKKSLWSQRFNSITHFIVNVMLNVYDSHFSTGLPLPESKTA